MKAGNKEYKKVLDLNGKPSPLELSLFPLSGALLLPGGNMQLNIFEPRYLAMVEDSLSADCLIGMIQPDLNGAECDEGPELCKMGCIGRIAGYQESGDGRYMINLAGICRFHLVEEIVGKSGFRRASVDPIAKDLLENDQEIDRAALLDAFKRFLELNQMETDWDEVEKTDNEVLVTNLCMMSPYGPAEKQALLEADNLKIRAETLVAITEIALAKNSDNPESSLQ